MKMAEYSEVLLKDGRSACIVEVLSDTDFLAEVITHNPKYEKGQKVRLLSCNTGEKISNEYCFAEELANIMGVEVEAPNKKLYMYPNGNTKIGRQNEGEMIIYKPNDRRRLK